MSLRESDEANRVVMNLLIAEIGKINGWTVCNENVIGWNDEAAEHHYLVYPLESKHLVKIKWSLNRYTKKGVLCWERKLEGISCTDNGELVTKNHTAYDHIYAEDYKNLFPDGHEGEAGFSLSYDKEGKISKEFDFKALAKRLSNRKVFEESKKLMELLIVRSEVANGFAVEQKFVIDTCERLKRELPRGDIELKQIYNSSIRLTIDFDISRIRELETLLTSIKAMRA